MCNTPKPLTHIAFLHPEFPFEQAQTKSQKLGKLTPKCLNHLDKKPNTESERARERHRERESKRAPKIQPHQHYPSLDITQNVQNLKDTHRHCKRKNERKIIDLVEEKESLEVRLDRVGEGSGRVRAMLAAAIAAAAALTYLQPSLPYFTYNTHTHSKFKRAKENRNLSSVSPVLPSFLPATAWPALSEDAHTFFTL